MTKHDSIQRLIQRNAQAAAKGEKEPPRRTVEHAIAVEARLAQAVAARRKKERTAGGASAADLAESILARGAPGTSSPAVESVDWRDIDNIAQPAQPDYLFDSAGDEPKVDDDHLSAFFGGGGTPLHQVEHVDELTPESVSATSTFAQAEVAAVATEKTENRPAMNHSRLQHILDQISGKT